MTRPSEEPLPSGLEAVLREESWLKRLAVGLVGDPAQAEDLAQDVVATALRERPAASGPRLKAWLRTTARRLAARSGERERNRRRAELAAARPETADRRAEDRLTLHQRLNDAIQALEPPYRTALVLRYLEELPPREIAKRLEISDEAARKRVSRGLALLRGKLDDDFGSRRSWLGPVGALAFGEGWSPVPAPDVALPTSATAAGGTASLVGLVSLKNLIVGGVAAGVVLVIVARTNQRPEAPEVSATPRTSEAAAPVEPARIEDPAATETPDAGADARTALAAAAPTEGTTAGRVSVVDGTGTAVPDAVCVWLDADGGATRVPLDERGTAALPEGCADLRFVAGAEGHAAAVARAVDEDTDLVLVLEQHVTLRGRLLVDGGPPEAPVTLLCAPWNNHLDLGHPLEEGQKPLLWEHDLLEEAHELVTRPDGSFQVAGLHPGSTGRLILEDSYRVPAFDDEPVAFYAASDGEVVVETVRVPRVFGRVVWADDGTPAGGGMTISYEDRGTGTGFMAGKWLRESGEFEVGLPLADRDDPGSQLQHAKVTIEFEPEEHDALENSFTFEVAATDLPLDVGTLELRRAATLRLRLEDSEGAPVAGATVASALEYGTTDDAGRTELAFEPDDALVVYATGFDVVRPRVADLEVGPTGERRIALDRDARGVTLTVETPDVTVGVVARSNSPTLSIGYDDSLLAGGSTLGDEQTRGDVAILFRALGDRLLSIGHGQGSPQHVAKFRATREPLVLSGLQPGLELQLALRDALGQVMAESTLTLPETPGRVDTTLAAEDFEGGTLTVLVTDEAGRPLPDARVLVRVHGQYASSQATTSGRRVLAPVAAGSYGLVASAPGHLQTEVEGEFPGGEHSITVALPLARAVTVAFEDPRGSRVQADSVSIASADGWTSEWKRPESAEPTRFHQAPFTPLHVHAKFGALEVRHEVDAGIDELVVPAPSLGLLRVEVPDPPPAVGDWGHLYLRVDDVALLGSDRPSAAVERTDETPEGRLWKTRSYTADAVGALALEVRLPVGTYDVELVFTEDHDDDAPRRSLLRREVTIEHGGRRVLTAPAD